MIRYDFYQYQRGVNIGGLPNTDICQQYPVQVGRITAFWLRLWIKD